MCEGATCEAGASGAAHSPLTPPAAGQRQLRATPSTDSVPESVYTPAAGGGDASPATPEKRDLATPRKRRRLTIRVALARGAEEDKPRKAAPGGDALREEDPAPCPLAPRGEAPQAVGHPAPETPSRGDGFTDRAERAARLLTSALARALVRKVLAACGGGSGQAGLGAQLSACRGVQAFYESVSMRHESHEVLHFGAALAALKAAGVPCGAEDVLRAGGLRAEPATRPLCAWISEVESFVSAALGDVDRAPEQPLELAAHFARDLADGLAGCEEFRRACARPEAVARQLAPHVARLAACFVVDSHQGPDAPRLPPRTLAAAATALATRYVLGRGGVELSADDCFEVLRGARPGADGRPGEHAVSYPLAPERLRSAVAAIADVSRLWLEESRGPAFDACRPPRADVAEVDLAP